MINWTYNQDQRWFEICCEGTFTDDEMVSVIGEVLASGKLEPGARVLADNSRLKRVMTPRQMRLLLVTLAPVSERIINCRMATVVPNSRSLVITRTLAAFAPLADCTWKPFMNRAAAVKWLASS